MAKKEDRKELILHEVNVHNRILVTDLANLLKVSVDTVRRDIQDLHSEGLLVKVHGGAVSNAYKIQESIEANSVYAFESKTIIARKAVDLISDSNVVLISGGTTNLELVKRLPLTLKATFFTPSLSIAKALLVHPELEVIFIGGRISKPSQISVGGSALNTLSEIKVDICFLGTGYLDPVNGLSEFDWEVVQMKKAMIKSSKHVVSLTISEKLNSQQRYRICEAHQINTLITELDKADEILEAYRKQNINIL